MHRRITILLIASALVVAVHSDVLKCYMCTSLSDEGCGSAFNNSLQPVECTVNKIFEWQRDLQQHRTLSKIVSLFGIDEALQHSQRTPQNMACAKMVLNVDKVDKEVIVRTCQTNKTDHIDPCTVMEGKIQKDQLGMMKNCDLCHEDACNGTTVVSPEIFYALLSLLGALINVAFYHWA
ncbi:uncharacterized protein LOC115233777 [Formica exsecta]|uniref:uncharacterized protein LOC115233777 n=1 Tax=Formica exsecta TaxID=72781 RepID=UPI001142CC4C|nr:uncharacterized protein LOC115233777 [Formica exsecta]